jgi:hypothetical protein
MTDVPEDVLREVISADRALLVAADLLIEARVVPRAGTKRPIAWAPRSLWSHASPSDGEQSDGDCN